MFVWWLLSRSSVGFGFRAVGENPRAARVAGIDTGRATVNAMLVAGGLVGLAGASQVLGGVTTGFSSDIDAAVSFADGMGADEIARYRPAFLEITHVLERAGLNHDRHGVSPVNPEFALTHRQWEAAARGWLARPTQDDAVVKTCLLVDGRPIHGDLTLPEVARVFGDLRLHPSTMKVLLAISVDRAKAPRGRWRRKQVDLKRQALLPIASATGTLNGVTRNGAAVTFSTQTIKGISYAVFTALARRVSRRLGAA